MKVWEVLFVRGKKVHADHGEINSVLLASSIAAFAGEKMELN